MENVDPMASRPEMEMAWTSGGMNGKTGVKQTSAPPPSAQGVLRVCASEALTDHDHDLGPPGFRSLRRFGKRSMLGSVGCIFECF